MNLSVIIHTKNSEKTIEQALKSVIFANEIVVVDMKSTDKTQDICRKYTSNIYEFKDVGFVEPARNYGISKAHGDWCLIVDADEEIPLGLSDKIIDLTKRDEYVAWKLPRKNIIFGSWLKHAGWWPDYIIRLFRTKSVQWPEKVHSVPIVSGKIGTIDAREDWAIIHHNYDSVRSFIDRLNKYSDIAPKTHKDPLNAFTAELMKRYFQEQAYLDGDTGVAAAVLQSMYEFVVSVKQREIIGLSNNRQSIKPMENLKKELAYWVADYHCQHQNNMISKFIWQFRRKYKL